MTEHRVKVESVVLPQCMSLGLTEARVESRREKDQYKKVLACYKVSDKAMTDRAAPAVR